MIGQLAPLSCSRKFVITSDSDFFFFKDKISKENAEGEVGGHPNINRKIK